MTYHEPHPKPILATQYPFSQIGVDRATVFSWAKEKGLKKGPLTGVFHCKKAAFLM